LDVVRGLKSRVPASRRRQLAKLRVSLRTPTAPLRGLPDALVIGAQRSGTSSIYKYLGAHPQVVPSIRKEIEYFSTSFDEGEAWYRAHFPLEARRVMQHRLTDRPVRTFEATPDYLLDPRAAQRAAERLPSARIIALLRNPVDRAFSHYLHSRRLGFEPLGFAQAIAEEPKRLAGEYERLLEDPTYKARSLRRYSYVERGRYAEQLTRWLSVYPSGAVLVVRFEDLVSRPEAVLTRIETFLAIDPWQPRSFTNHSYGRKEAAPVATIPPGVRAHLEEVFQPLNDALKDLFPEIAWSSGPSSHKGTR
jgi:hypothetical protein